MIYFLCLFIYLWERLFVIALVYSSFELQYISQDIKSWGWSNSTGGKVLTLHMAYLALISSIPDWIPPGVIFLVYNPPKRKSQNKTQNPISIRVLFLKLFVAFCNLCYKNRNFGWQVLLKKRKCLSWSLLPPFPQNHSLDDLFLFWDPSVVIRKCCWDLSYPRRSYLELFSRVSIYLGGKLEGIFQIGSGNSCVLQHP